MNGERILFPSVLLLGLIGGCAWGADDSAQFRVGGMAVVEGDVSIRLPAKAPPGDAVRPRASFPGAWSPGAWSPGAWSPGAWAAAGRNDPVAAGMAVRTE